MKVSPEPLPVSEFLLFISHDKKKQMSKRVGSTSVPHGAAFSFLLMAAALVANADPFIGGSGANDFTGTDRRDVFVTDGGNDYVVGNDGNDIILLGDGNDTAFAGPGDDRTNGGDGADEFIFDPGDSDGEDFTDGGDAGWFDRATFNFLLKPAQISICIDKNGDIIVHDPGQNSGVYRLRNIEVLDFIDAQGNHNVIIVAQAQFPPC